MVFAGGTLAAAACADNAGTAADAAADAVTSGGCCNANPDPCCQVLACGLPMTAACACEMGGGTPNYEMLDGGGITVSSMSCSFRGDVGDGGDGGQLPQDAGPTDASLDAVVYVGEAGCCNANPDPCCYVLGCGEPMNAACACQMEGGTRDCGIR